MYGRSAHSAPDLATKLAVATEIREAMDSTRDAELTRVMPYLVPAAVELIQSSQPSFQRDSTEYLFRRTLIDIIHRFTPAGEPVRSNATSIFQTLLTVVRLDNEENGAVACKTLVDIARNNRVVTEQAMTEFMTFFQEMFVNMKGLAEEYLSESSVLMDPNIVLPSLRSFKVLGEMAMVLVVMSQVQRPLVTPHIQTANANALEFLTIEAPAQLKMKSDYEAMGNLWAGMAETIKNTTLYNDMTQAQMRVCFSFACLKFRDSLPSRCYPIWHMSCATRRSHMGTTERLSSSALFAFCKIAQLIISRSEG
jgi:transformation/transcription domain-associated protein